MAVLAYLFYIFTTLAAGFLIYYILNRPKKSSRIGNSPSARYNFVRRVLPLDKSNWKLNSVVNGVRVWAKSGNRSLFATSAILPVSLKAVKEVLTDSSLILEWNSRIKTASRISVSNGKDNSSDEHTGDVISVTETSNASFSLLGVFDSFINLFKNDSKLYARTWHFEEDIQFWLHSAVVEPQSADPIFTLFMVFPIKEKKEKCQLIIASEPQFRFNPGVLTASLAGLQDLIASRQSEVVLPNIKDDKPEGSVVVDGDSSSDDGDDDDNEKDVEESDSPSPGQHEQTPSEVFVDVTGVYYSPEKDLQKYKVVIDGALKKLMECYNAKDNQNGWNFVGIIKDVEILKKPASPTFSIWDCSKGTIEINVPLHYLLAYLDDMNKTSEYDDMYDTGQVIESLGKLTKVIYLEYKGIWPVSGRDFCSVSAIRILQDGTIAFFAKHAKHPSCPPCKKYVRWVSPRGFTKHYRTTDGGQPAVIRVKKGKILTGGFVMKILSDNPPRIETTYITHVDLQGSVPSRIVNKITANQPASVGLVKKFVEEMYKEELDNPNRAASKFKTDALTMAEKLQRAREVMAKTPSSDEVAEVPIVTSQSAPALQALNGDVRRASNSQSNENPSPSHSSSSPSIHGSPFEYGGLDYKTIGNQASAGLMQEAFEVSEVDLTKPTGPSVYEQWQYQETDRKVLIFRKIHQNEKMHSFIGKGIIACPPPKIWEILKEPENAYRYNNMLKETRTLEKLNDTQRIEYLHFETEKCFKKEARDFIALRTARKEKDKYLMSFVSIDYPNSPSKKDVKRGKIIASGWVVEPLLHNGQLYSMVTYLAQVNPGGSYPAMLINITGRKQPLCLAYLRRMIENPNQSMNRSFSQSLDETSRS